MGNADGWFICRAGYVETVRAVGLAAGKTVAKTVAKEWSMFGIVEIDQRLVEDAAALAINHGLRSLDAMHLAAALVLPQEDLVFATWDRRLHLAAGRTGLILFPENLS
jgi:predicted nucleic acid-binding protein